MTLRRILRFLRRDDGAATVEIVLLFPLIMWPFFMAMESGMMQMRRVMFERAVDVVARDIRLGDPTLQSFDAIRAAVCDETLVIPNCLSDLYLEMYPVPVANFAAPTESTKCRDRAEDVQPALTVRPGGRNELMMMRFCVLYDPILPGAGVGAQMDVNTGGRGVAMIAETFFVNEP
ncbi:TadE/TadG family type IV pilus assembly protein [Palleronia abyssalis]|uniref:Flp pilus assembly protein TadG n=1 Tax=Palleronia abyssalis TaxID=1501240 RepID=A0A2R8BUZ4_9RHOB|nr:hypothetical protein [Palleronia abyssalis]SPJ23981.1 hypothetical protein PAA8504_01803 [Palleronia abyssalis]